MRTDSQREDDAEKTESKSGHQEALNQQLDQLSELIERTRVLYEQHFMGIMPIAPFKEHAEIKKRLRSLFQQPFRSSTIRFRLKTIESRYRTYNTYWEKVLKQREEGTYFRDVFKAELHAKEAAQAEREKTTEGKASKQMVELFNSYKKALEESGGKKQNLNFDAFQKSLIDRAKDIKSSYGVKKVSFKVVVKEGKVTVQAKGKKE